MQSLGVLRGRRAQIFTVDLTLGILIMTAALLSFVAYLMSEPAPLRDDAERLETLMTSGTPADWNETTVELVGFLSGERFNQTKIEYFANQSVATQRRWLGIRSDFTIRFTVNGTTIPLCSTCGTVPAAYDELLPIKRYGVLNSTIATMEVALYR